jgi:hypothetical protein
MAITLKNKNFAFSTLSSTVSQAAATLTVVAGNLFPVTGNFKAVIWSSTLASPSEDTNREIILVTANSSNSFSIVRAQEGTLSPTNWPLGSKIAHTITAGKIDELEAEINSKHTPGVNSLAWTNVNKTGAQPSDIGAAAASHTQAESTITFTDIPTGDVSISAHGYAPRLPNDPAKFLNGTGSYTVPAGSGGSSVSAAIAVADLVFGGTTTVGVSPDFSRGDHKHAMPAAPNATSVGLPSVTNDAQVKRSEMGAINGVATLDGTGKVPVGQLANMVPSSTTVNAKPLTGNIVLTYPDIGELKTINSQSIVGTGDITIASGSGPVTYANLGLLPGATGFLSCLGAADAFQVSTSPSFTVDNGVFSNGILTPVSHIIWPSPVVLAKVTDEFATDGEGFPVVVGDYCAIKFGGFGESVELGSFNSTAGYASISANYGSATITAANISLLGSVTMSGLLNGIPISMPIDYDYASIVTKSASFSLAVTDMGKVYRFLASTPTGQVITLNTGAGPISSWYNAQVAFELDYRCVYPVTITTNGSKKIDGSGTGVAVSKTIFPGEFIVMKYDAGSSSWVTIHRNNKNADNTNYKSLPAGAYTQALNPVAESVGTYILTDSSGGTDYTLNIAHAGNIGRKFSIAITSSGASGFNVSFPSQAGQTILCPDSSPGNTFTLEVGNVLILDFICINTSSSNSTWVEANYKYFFA